MPLHQKLQCSHWTLANSFLWSSSGHQSSSSTSTMACNTCSKYFCSEVLLQPNSASHMQRWQWSCFGVGPTLTDAGLSLAFQSNLSSSQKEEKTATKVGEWSSSNTHDCHHWLKCHPTLWLAQAQFQEVQASERHFSCMGIMTDRLKISH